MIKHCQHNTRYMAWGRGRARAIGLAAVAAWALGGCGSPAPIGGAGACVDPAALIVVVEALGSADNGVRALLERGATGTACVTEQDLSVLIDSGAASGTDDERLNLTAEIVDLW